MNNKFSIEIEKSENKYDRMNTINEIQIINDDLVNDFLTKNLSLESLIENKIYKIFN